MDAGSRMMAVGTAAIGIRETAASSIRHYFDQAAERLGLHPEMQRLLSIPFREVTAELPLRRDDERLQLFHGYRVQHNGVRGPLMGSVRLHLDVDLEALRAAAESMTWQCAVADVPFGGAAGGISCDPSQLNTQELQRLIRRYGARIHHLLGVYQDVCLPGRNAGREMMTWITDEYSDLNSGIHNPGAGKPVHLGGLPEWDRMIGQPIAALTGRAAADFGMPISGLRVAIRSLDETAFHTAGALQKMGATIVAISERRGGIRCSTGIDTEELGRHLHACGSFNGYEAAAPTTEVHHLDCDVLVIGAPECTLNNVTSGRVKAKLVVETSELVITPSAARNFHARNITVVPDLVAGTAAVLTANAEWLHNEHKTFLDQKRLAKEVERGLLRVYEQVLDRSQREDTSMRRTAYSLAVERVARAERLRVA